MEHVLTAPTIDFAVGDILLGAYSEYRQRREDGSLEPTIVGHDDLHAGNITFTQTDGQRRPHGVFDFGLTKPSTPERELRHLALWGRDVLDAAVDTYQTTTGTTLSLELIGFWAVTQAATNYSYRLLAGNAEKIRSSQADLRCLLADKDLGDRSVAGKAFMRDTGSV